MPAIINLSAKKLWLLQTSKRRMYQVRSARSLARLCNKFRHQDTFRCKGKTMQDEHGTGTMKLG